MPIGLTPKSDKRLKKGHSLYGLLTKLIRFIIHYMKAVMIGVFTVFMGLFAYLLQNIIANHLSPDYDDKFAWLWCGLALLASIIAISYAVILGYREDKKKNKLIDQKINPEVQTVTSDTKTYPKTYSWHQRIILWLYKKDKLPQ